MTASSSTGASPGASFLLFLLLVVLLGLYFVPTLVALTRHVPHLGWVIVINLFLGWSLVGWVIALAMAARSLPETNQELDSRHPQPGPREGGG
jgi:hypothetical protein